MAARPRFSSSTSPACSSCKLSGAGAYTLELGIAGDVNEDGLVDGADSAAVTDVSGDGAVDAADRQLVAANYGFRANSAPTVAADLPDVLTHVDLAVTVDLGTVASDPDGDRVYYRIVGVTGGTASITASGAGLVFTPTAGSSVRRHDQHRRRRRLRHLGARQIDLAVSDAPLLAIDFVDRAYDFAVRARAPG